MFVFEYDHVNYKDLAQSLAAALGVTMEKGRLVYPPHVAKGYLQTIEMQGGLQAMAFDYTFADSFRLRRKKINQEYYTLWFTEIDPHGNAHVEIDNDRFQVDRSAFSTALLTSSLFDANYEMPAGTRMRGVNILLDNQWLAYHLGVDSKSGLLHKYLSLKASRITMEPLDTDYKKLLQDVIDLINGNGQFKHIAIQNRIMLLIERFFMRMAVKMEADNLDIKLSREDISRVMEVESLITRDVFNPAPFIPELARMVNISETKLKNNFKTVFGVPIYQYFQKARMRAARDVLETNKYSIKQVALEMGYVNLSNFSTAFRKEFGILPSQLNNV
ncbi:MAG: AraC family transcriptional regulator [Chitinophagaceae bacterium]